MVDRQRRPGPVAERWQWQLRGHAVAPTPTCSSLPTGERGSFRARREAAAVAVCRGCVVRAACRAYALAAEEPCGVWGGLTENARAVLVRDTRHTRAAD